MVGFYPEPYFPGEKIYYTRKAEDGSCLSGPVSPMIKDVNDKI